MGQISYTTAELDAALAEIIEGDYLKVKRKTLTPSRLASYLPAATPYTTPTLVAATPTKLLLPTTVKTIQDFSLDGPNNRFFLSASDVVDREFQINASTSMTASTNNTVVTLGMRINGVFEEGVSIDRKIGTGSDVGAIGFSGSFKLSTNDYIEVFVTSSLGGTITFSKTAINILEVN